METKRERAIEHMQERRYANAIPLFLELLEENSNDSTLYYMIGQCYRFTNDIETAIKFLEKAKVLDPNDANTYQALGIAYQLVEQYERAINLFSKSIELDEEMILSYNSMGLTYKKVGNLSLALKWYFAALDKRVEIAEDESKKKISQEEQDEYEKNNEMEIKYRIAFPVKGMKDNLESDLDYAAISNNIGACYFEAEEYSEAQKWFINAIESTPKGYEYNDPYLYLEEMRERNIPLSLA